MTGSCWRLLACFSLIFLPPALPAQDVPADRARVIAPDSPSLRSAPLSLRLPLPVTVPWRDPILRGPIGFPQIVHVAGIIFSGHVTFVGGGDGQSPSQAQAVSSTIVTFQVERAFRGTSTGQSLTIHEWSGLWTGKDKERYRVGEHVFLFLYSPSKLGLTSPVAGAVGRFAIDRQGNISMNAQNVLALAADPVIGGRRVVPYSDFIRAVQHAGGME